MRPGPRSPAESRNECVGPRFQILRYSVPGGSRWQVIATLCLVVAVSLALLACEPRDVDVELGEAVKEFHTLYNQQKFDEIYDRSSRIFRRRLSREANAKIFAALYAKNGSVVSTKQDNKNVDSTPVGRVFVLTYTTTFEHGTSAEFIGFRKSATESGMLLAIYERE